MKKLFGFIAGLLFTSSAFANVITVQPFSADSSVSHMENFRSTVVTVINGNIAGSSGGTSSVNILADSVGEIDMADDANPRLRDSELLGITVDTTSSQLTYVYTGLTPATSASLTSNISAGTAYINGYRVAKSATSHTYTASKDTYVDLNQSGTYTFSEVANGAAAPTVAANSARLAKVVTDGTTISSVTDLANRRIPGLATATNYRSGLRISRDSASTVAVLPGVCEINNSMVSKTSTTTLNLATASDWAGGTSLRAASTMGFVGIDTSGNLKLHTTAPTHDNYGVSTTTGKKRYATWSSTVYRILGWFYMNGAQQVYEAEIGNIKEGDVDNCVMSNDTNYLSFASSSLTDMNLINFYSSGGKVSLFEVISGDCSGALGFPIQQFSRGSTVLVGSAVADTLDDNTSPYTFSNQWLDVPAPSQGTLVYKAQMRMRNQTYLIGGRRFIVREE